MGAGSTVEKPINSAPAVCLILLGVFNWLTALGGLLGLSRLLCCLDIFLVLDSVNVILTLTLVAELFMNFDGLVSSIGGCCAGTWLQVAVHGRRTFLRASAEYAGTSKQLPCRSLPLRSPPTPQTPSTRANTTPATSGKSCTVRSGCSSSFLWCRLERWWSRFW